MKVTFKDAEGEVTGYVKHFYDPNNRRIKKELYDGEDTLTGGERYVYDHAGTLLFVLNNDDDLAIRHFTVGAQVVGQLRTGDDFEWILTDRLGSNRALVTPDGTQTAGYGYDAYGNPIGGVSGPLSSTRVHWTGLMRDEETGLYYAWHRYYDPTIGTWISRDWIVDNPYNMYGYVGNDPINKTDPSGLAPPLEALGNNCLEGCGWNRPAAPLNYDFLDSRRWNAPQASTRHKMLEARRRVYVDAAALIDERFGILQQSTANMIEYARLKMSVNALHAELTSAWEADERFILRNFMEDGQYIIPKPIPRMSALPADHRTPYARRQAELQAIADDPKQDLATRRDAQNEQIQMMWAASPWSVRFFGPSNYQPGWGSVTRFETALTIGVGGAAAVRAFARPAVAPSNVVAKVGEEAKQFLGSNYRVITNKAGDKIFMSEDGLRKMRFDFNNTQGDLPHVHLEVFENGRWKDAIPGTHRIYPQP